MACNAFEYQDPEGSGELIGLHYYLKEEVSYRGEGMDAIEDETLVDKWFINRTEMDVQDFRIKFSKELEYMNVVKSLMFQREQKVQVETVDIPAVTSGQAFDQFRSEGISILLYEAEA